MRSDSLLNTGQTSASFAPKVDPTREKRREELKERRVKLTPAGEIVNEEVQKQIDMLLTGTYQDEDKMTDAQFRAERRGRRLAVERLRSFQMRLNMILRERTEENPDGR